MYIKSGGGAVYHSFHGISLGTPHIYHIFLRTIMLTNFVLVAKSLFHRQHTYYSVEICNPRRMNAIALQARIQIFFLRKGGGMVVSPITPLGSANIIISTSGSFCGLRHGTWISHKEGELLLYRVL